ncbi:GNAT family N-acetyltransferase [Patulibacter sp.]|uniref:GNAT family N-acetyltransferase n=1 Tax=Patulibacter sp. TaxID=1912859 RepID=UPI002727BE57|nr:GNAT family N-acetyltransferase [Patulibacter sp.]MDO9408704.1 GNAT family N-acetyltransferase [Patulibacter sp.]
MPVLIRPVRTRGDLNAFVDLPFRLRKDDPNWVTLPRFAIKQELNRKRNPWFDHAEAEYLLAERDGRVVGRITAHVDRALQEFQDVRWGQFGWFECEDDQEATDALLDAAAAWVKERGCDRLVGPFSFTTNDECGMLLAGQHRPPIVLTGWHPTYYRRLMEDAGMARAMDTLMWDLHVRDRANVHPMIWRIADRVESEHGIKVRYFSKKNIAEEVGRFLDVYNAAWEKNWGFVPLNEKEVRHYAKDLSPLLDENWAMVAEIPETGEVVGAALTIPDFNQVLIHARDGRLTPGNLLRLWRHRKDPDRVRVFALGVKPNYQHTGVGAKLYEMHYQSAQRTPQGGGECGWILESNTAMNKAMQKMGGTLARRYRFYERLLEDDAVSSAPKDTKFTGDWIDEDSVLAHGAAGAPGT